VASTQHNDGLITYDIAVPKELANIVILDASHNIRDLIGLDTTIQQADFEPMVSYQNVTVHQLRHASGRSKMTQEFKKKQEDRKVSLEIAQVVKQIPPDEAIILFTFKARHREVDFQSILKRDLEKQGIDTTAKLPGSGLDRFVWLTWGNETSLSEFSYCSNVIFAGVLHRDWVDLASAIAGQSDDLLLDITNEQVREVERSEIAHCLYQAMSRGSSRIVRGELTLPMKVWLIHKDEGIRDVIQKVMPGIRWGAWEPEHLLSKGKIELTTDRILDCLKGLPLTTARVATRTVKKQLDLGDMPKMTFTCAVKAISDGWTLAGQSLARVGSPFS